jgi:hypothetical protein
MTLCSFLSFFFALNFLKTLNTNRDTLELPRRKKKREEEKAERRFLQNHIPQINNLLLLPPFICLFCAL